MGSCCSILCDDYDSHCHHHCPIDLPPPCDYYITRTSPTSAPPLHPPPSAPPPYPPPSAPPLYPSTSPISPIYYTVPYTSNYYLN